MVDNRLILLFTMLFSVAQTSTGAAFLNNGGAPRSEAMGGAFTAVADDLDAFYYNPAGYAFQQNGRFNSYYSKVDNEQDILYFGAGEKLSEKLYFAVNMLSSSLAGIPETTYSGGTVVDSGSSFDYSASALNFAGAYAFSPKWAVGFNLKMIQESLYKNSASGSGADLGIFYKYSDTLRFGYLAANLVKPVMVWDTDSGNEDEVYANNRLGISYWLDDGLLVAYDLNLGQNEISNHLGLEYLVNELMSLRAGMSDNAYYIGLGMLLERFHLDYSYANKYDSLIESTHKIAIGYSWGDVTPKKINKKFPVVASSKEQIKAQLATPVEQEQVEVVAEDVVEIKKEEAKPFDFDEVVDQDFSKVNLSSFLVSAKRSFVKNGKTMKCFYKLENKSQEAMKIKISTKVLDSNKNKLIGSKSDTVSLPAGTKRTFSLLADLTKQVPSYKIKTYFRINDRETIEYIDRK